MNSKADRKRLKVYRPRSEDGKGKPVARLKKKAKGAGGRVKRLNDQRSRCKDMEKEKEKGTWQLEEERFKVREDFKG